MPRYKYGVKGAVGLSFERIHVTVQINNQGIPYSLLPFDRRFYEERFQLCFGGGRTKDNSSFGLKSMMGVLWSDRRGSVLCSSSSPGRSRYGRRGIVG